MNFSEYSLNILTRCFPLYWHFEQQKAQRFPFLGWSKHKVKLLLLSVQVFQDAAKLLDKLPRRSTYEDEFGEELWSPNRGQNSDHGRDRVTNISTALDTKSIEDMQKVINIGIESGVTTKIEAIRVNTARTHKVIEDNPIITQEKW